MDRAEAEQVVEEGCDHPSVFDGHKRWLGGWCHDCDVEINRLIPFGDPFWATEPQWSQ